MSKKELTEQERGEKCLRELKQALDNNKFDLVSGILFKDSFRGRLARWLSRGVATVDNKIVPRQGK